MKKTFVILTIVLALLAAPVFAEVTASGEVNYQWMFNADDYEEAIDSNDFVLDLGGTVGDYTSIAAEFEAEYGDTDGDFNNDTVDSTGDVWMNSATITQDVTGALGIEAPVSLSMTFGIDDFDPQEYNDMAYGDFDLDGELYPGTIMTKASIGFNDMVTLDVAMYEDYKLGFNVYGSFVEKVDVSVYYLKDFTTSTWDFSSKIPSDADDPYCIGVNASLAAMEGLDLGAGFEYGAWDTDSDLDSVLHYGLSAVYTMDTLEVTLGTWTKSYDGHDDFAEVTSVKLGAEYGLSGDIFSVTGAVGVTQIDPGDYDFEDVVIYEVGAKASIDGVTYCTGYSLYSDDFGSAGGFLDDDGDRAGNFYFNIGAEF